MSYISLLRQRIKVIQTIRKTTSAMRLATRAIQSRLRNKKEIFNTYVKAIETIRQQYTALSSSPTKLLCADNTQKTAAASTKLVILIGSHKGLCGAFNERLFSYFKNSVRVPDESPIVTVGTQATQFIALQGIKPLRTFNNFTSITLLTIAQELMQVITSRAPADVIIVSNKARTFFLQQPQSQEIVTATPSTTDTIEALLCRLTLQSTVIQLLYDSLLAEQSARFLSMDNATRNAEDILKQAKIDYNKLRQALVTRELLELTSSFSTD